MSAKDVTTRSTSDLTVGREFLNNGVKVLLLDGRHRLGRLCDSFT